MKNEEMDSLFRDEINGLEGLPNGVSWTKEQGWDKLNTRMHRKPVRRTLPLIGGLTGFSKWSYAAAAAVTMLLSVNFIYQHYDNQSVTDVMISESIQEEIEQKAAPQLDQLISGLESNQVFDQFKQILTFPDENAAPSPIVIQNESLLQQISILGLDPATGQQPNLMNSSNSKFNSDANLMLASLGMDELMTNYDQEISEFPDNPMILSHNRQNSSIGVQFNGNTGLQGSLFTGGINADLSFYLPDNSGRKKHKLTAGLATNYQVFDLKGQSKGESSQDNDITSGGVNTFVTVGYQRNFSNHDKKPLWAGVKAGYMIQNSSSNFDQNTVMVELNVGNQQTGKVTVGPQIYITDNFKKVIPGIKIGVNINAYEKDIAI